MSADTTPKTKSQSSGIEPFAVDRLEAARLLGVSGTTLWRIEQRGLIAQIPGLRGKYSVDALRRLAAGGMETGSAA